MSSCNFFSLSFRCTDERCFIVFVRLQFIFLCILRKRVLILNSVRRYYYFCFKAQALFFSCLILFIFGSFGCLILFHYRWWSTSIYVCMCEFEGFLRRNKNSFFFLLSLLSAAVVIAPDAAADVALLHITLFIILFLALVSTWNSPESWYIMSQLVVS